MASLLFVLSLSSLEYVTKVVYLNQRKQQIESSSETIVLCTTVLLDLNVEKASLSPSQVVSSIQISIYFCFTGEGALDSSVLCSLTWIKWTRTKEKEETTLFTSFSWPLCIFAGSDRERKRERERLLIFSLSPASTWTILLIPANESLDSNPCKCIHRKKDEKRIRASESETSTSLDPEESLVSISGVLTFGYFSIATSNLDISLCVLQTVTDTSDWEIQSRAIHPRAGFNMDWEMSWLGSSKLYLLENVTI